MKNFYLSISVLFMSLNVGGQIIDIPDANFKAKLLEANPTNQIAYNTNSSSVSIKIDANDNGEIEVSEALLVGRLNVDNSSIGSLVGIEAFTNLRRLSCKYNLLTSLEINSLSILKVLDCSHNLLTNLNCQNISNTIDYFDCSYNSLTSLVLPNFFEFLDMGDQTIYANCSHNQLTSIVFSANEQLSSLDLSYNNFTSLSFTHLEIYGSLGFSHIPLTSLDLSNVYVGGQHPDEIVGFSLEYTNLTELYIPFGVTGGSINNNPNLVHLNIKNGYYNMRWEYEYDEFGEETGNYLYYGMTIENNPNLALICTDDTELGYYSVIVPPTVQVTEYCNFTPGGNYNQISGTVTYSCPGGTPVNSNVKVKINNAYTASFAEDGNYNVFTSYGTQNVFLEFLEPNYFTVSPPNYTFNFPAYGNNETANFCVSPNGVHPDLEVTILPLTIARPGFDAKYKLIIKNKGTETQSGTVALTFDDDVLDYVSAAPAITAQSVGLLTWDYANLNPFEDKEITFTVNVNSPVETPSVNIGDILQYSVLVSTSQTDETPTDNQMDYNQTVVGSMDPNDKTVLEGSQVSISRVGDYLNYLVRFQNTGTAAAENVVVKDYLSYKFDVSSLQMISASHPYKCLFVGGIKMDVIFENINLPASSVDEEGSHGYFAFRVKPRTATVVDDTIENTAYIYFDYNYPIVTNTVSTTFTTLGISDNENNLFRIFPNPTSDIINIGVSNNQPIKATITTILGQTIMSSETTTIDISSLTKGTYFITVETYSGIETQQIIKQ